MIERSSPMSISRTTEVKASSTQSFDDAMRKGIARAQKTLRHVKSAWIWNQEVLLDDTGKITEYRVQMKITFLLDE
jgi:flavin-binding protein dodecin